MAVYGLNLEAMFYLLNITQVLYNTVHNGYIKCHVTSVVLLLFVVCEVCKQVASQVYQGG